VLEAMSLGVPTITSNISSMPEIAGDAGMQIDPNDITSISLTIERILSDHVLYEKLQKLSIEQASKFSWDKTAKKTLQLYQELKN
jgi:glycosyltransferase involved in cell wall biosynthesis